MGQAMDRALQRLEMSAWSKEGGATIPVPSAGIFSAAVSAATTLGLSSTDFSVVVTIFNSLFVLLLLFSSGIQLKTTRRQSNRWVEA